MSGTFVNQDRCLPAPYGTKIYTQGLATCAGAVAYGLPYNNDASYANKVMAHASAPRVDATMGQFIQNVQSSGMTVYGVCLSLPDPKYNDNRDGEIRQMLLDAGYQANQITSDVIKSQKTALKQHLQTFNARVTQYCQQLGVPIQTLSDRSRPHGTMEASGSPRGKVKAEGSKMADIPDIPAAASSSSSSKSRGGTSGATGGGYAGGSGYRGGAPSGGHTGSSSHRGTTTSGSGRSTGGTTSHKTTSSSHKSSSSSKTGRR